MEPGIGVGDLVFIKSVEQQDIKVNDIISFRDGGSPVTHRVVKIEENEDGELEYTTKGDNNNAEDNDTIKYENIIGKLNAKIPYVGRIILFIQKYIIAVIGIFVFIGVYIITKPEIVQNVPKEEKPKKLDKQENAEKQEKSKRTEKKEKHKSKH